MFVQDSSSRGRNDICFRVGLRFDAITERFEGAEPAAVRPTGIRTYALLHQFKALFVACSGVGVLFDPGHNYVCYRKLL